MKVTAVYALLYLNRTSYLKNGKKQSQVGDELRIKYNRISPLTVKSSAAALLIAKFANLTVQLSNDHLI